MVHNYIFQNLFYTVVFSLGLDKKMYEIDLT